MNQMRLQLTSGGVYTLVHQEGTSLTWRAMSEDWNNIKMSTKEVVTKTAQVQRCNKPFNSGSERGCVDVEHRGSQSAETCKKVHVCTKHDYRFSAVSMLNLRSKITKQLKTKPTKTLSCSKC